MSSQEDYDKDITPKINNLDRGDIPQEIINVHQNNLNTDNNKNRLVYNDDNTSSNTHKIQEIYPKPSNSEESLK